MNYEEFLRSKTKPVKSYAITKNGVELHPSAKGHQKAVIKWALKNGRGLIALDFGLGKTHVQAELCRIAYEKYNRPTLTIAPLGVRHQFVNIDGPRLGIEYQYVNSDDAIQNANTPYLITNYERVRDGNINPKLHNFCLVTLDEGAVLRSLGSKTYHIYEQVFSDVIHKFVCTATPSPNRFRELIYYANFLGIMDNSQSLTRWFGRDVNKAGNLQLLPQYEEEFWLWVSTWAVFLYKPSDLGFSDEGYILPELNVFWHRLPIDYKRAWGEVDNKGQYRMLPDASGSATDAYREKRATLEARLEKTVEIVENYQNNPVKDHNGILIWHHLEYERHALKKVLPKVVEVYGSQDLEKREQRIIDFSNGKFDILASKPVLTGSGCNFQHHCHRNIFLGIDYKFADFIQAVHRTHRFLQQYPVEVHIIYSESEDKIANTLQRKWRQHNKLIAKMRAIVREYGLDKKALDADLKRTLGVARQEEKSKLFTLVKNDCVFETQNMKSNSVDLTITSVPFDNHFEYTTNVEDFGYNDNDFEEQGQSGFWKQMGYLTPELLRVTKPGRKAVIHVKDRILYSHQVDHGLTSVMPFSDECVMHFIKHGWVYEGRRTIVTDVVRENNSTYRLGYTEMTKDATKMGSGLPEYLLTFRKPNSNPSKQYSDERVTKIKWDNRREVYQCGNCEYQSPDLEYGFNFVEKEKLYTKYECPECGAKQIHYSRAKWQLDAAPFWQSDGNVLIAKEPYSFEEHVKEMERLDLKGNLSASYLQVPPQSKNEYVWDDVVFMQCLNSNQARRKTTNHICPLPLDIVTRAIVLYSNFGETVYDPFAGLGTVPYLAIKLGRIGMGVELNQDYFNNALEYCVLAETKKLAPTLFDYLEQKESVNV